MKNLKPIGIPHSIFLENLFARTYDSTKLNEDAERVRYYYQTKGYFKALVAIPRRRSTTPAALRWYCPFKNSPGKAVDITLPVEEGAALSSEGNHLHRQQGGDQTSRRLRALFKFKDGDIFDTEAMRKGLDNLRKAYAALGYINFTPVPTRCRRREEAPSACRSIWTKANSSSSAALSSRATRRPATKSFAANWRWKKARSTTAICGS